MQLNGNIYESALKEVSGYGFNPRRYFAGIQGLDVMTMEFRDGLVLASLKN